MGPGHNVPGEARSATHWWGGLAGSEAYAMSEAQPIRVIVVDDDHDVRTVTKLALATDKRLELVGEAHNGDAAFDLVGELRPDVVVMDVEMPGTNGWQATRRILDEYPDTRVIALTGHTDSDAVTRMVVAGALGYAVKGSDPTKLGERVYEAASRTNVIDPLAVPGLFQSIVQLARDEQNRREEAEALAVELKRSYRETVLALMNALRSRDCKTEEHGDRVASRVTAVGRRLGLNAAQLEDLEYGAIFHDIGKIGVPDSILHNTDELTDTEWAVIKQHTVVGERIIEPIGFLKNVARIVRHSHERWDGSGYPDGLAGEDIPIESRVIFACDAFDAMTTQRSYQNAMPYDEATARMRELAGVHFDPRVVDELLKQLTSERTPVAAAQRSA